MKALRSYLIANIRPRFGWLPVVSAVLALGLGVLATFSLFSLVRSSE